MMTVNQKIALLRAKLDEKGLHAYIIPSSDPHQSEYPPSYWTGREWISGFTGSAGTVVITKDRAFVWTDARYFLQAEMELKGTDFMLQKLQVQTQAEYLDWMCQNLKAGEKVACDFACFSIAQIESFQRDLTKQGIQLVDSGDLLVDIWKDRPSLSEALVMDHPVKYAGLSRTEKIQSIQQTMIKEKADWMLITTLDDIAWTLNLRGRDVSCNPVFLSYLIIGKSQSTLFINSNKVSPAIKKALQQAKVDIKEYSAIQSFVNKLPVDQTIWVDQGNLNAALITAISCKVFRNGNHVMKLKAIKNETECKHIRNVMRKDAVALIQAFMWLENKLNNGTVSEYDFAMEIARCRSQQAEYFGESFNAIIGYKSNGAIMHYRPLKNQCATIQKEGILLVDSGGQYSDGTTDITRMIAVGEPTPEQKTHYTLVLKGMIALSQAVFPQSTKGIQLDILARQFLWNKGLNYGHGTGHGVGFFMNVHEPPQGFVTALNLRGVTDIVPGMLTSNEPGFYMEGSHGIRCENLVLCINHPNPNGDVFYAFETVTLFPFDTRLLDTKEMTKSEIDWLNGYHKMVFSRVSRLLQQKEREWLKEKCKKIKK